jgi:acyl-CoA hydrolase
MSESFNQEYQRKLISAKEAAGRVNSGNCIHIGGGANVATVIDANLALRKDELENVTVHTFTDTTSYQICSRDPEGEVFKWYSGFVLPSTKAFACKRGIGVCSPATWHSVPALIRSHLKLDILFLVTAPIDAKGYFNYGLMVGHMMAMAEVVAKVVVREDMPSVFNGHKEGLHISEVDYIVEDTETKT